MLVFLLLAMAAIVVVPVVLGASALPEARLGCSRSLEVAAAALGRALPARLPLPFRLSRERPQWRWVTWGSAVAGIGWLGGSMLFSYYVSNFGNYNETYGSLGAVIAFMTWLWLSTTLVLIGAEINAEMEHQTARDTTSGAPRPMGERGAQMADEVGKAA